MATIKQICEEMTERIEDDNKMVSVFESLVGRMEDELGSRFITEDTYDVPVVQPELEYYEDANTVDEDFFEQVQKDKASLDSFEEDMSHLFDDLGHRVNDILVKIEDAMDTANTIGSDTIRVACERVYEDYAYYLQEIDRLRNSYY